MWTANKQPAVAEHTLIVQTVMYTNDVDASKIQIIYKIEAVDYSAPWPDTLVKRQLAVLNTTVDVKAIPIGAPQPEPVIVPEPPDPVRVAQFQLDIANAQLVRLKQIADAQLWAADQTDPAVVAVLKEANTAQAAIPVNVAPGGIVTKVG